MFKKTDYLVAVNYLAADRKLCSKCRTFYILLRPVDYWSAIEDGLDRGPMKIYNVRHGYIDVIPVPHTEVNPHDWAFMCQGWREKENRAGG
jgi:hypothetical protein